MKTNNSTKYFAYVRKSSEGQERQALSIPAQKDKIKKMFPELDIEFIEEEKSAFKPGRTVFAQTMARLDKRERVGLIAYHPDRLSRNEVDASAITYRVRYGMIADLKFATYHFENNPEGIWMLQMALSQSQYESAKKGRDVKRGLEMKAKMGWRPSGAPVGYRNTPLKEKGFKTIEKDPERFPLVRRMWDLMLTSHHSVPQVLKMSREWGLTSVQHKSIGGKPITKSYAYKNIFTNPFYYGWFQYKNRDTGELVWQKGEHEPMITKEEYDHVQVILGRRTAPQPKRHHEMAFTGKLMRCASCGSSVTAEHKKKPPTKSGVVHEYIYYHCTKKKNPDCIERSVELKELNRQVLELLDELTISEKFKTWAIKNLHEIRTVEADSQEITLKKKHKELEDTDNQLQGLLLKFTSPQNANSEIISDNEYQTLKTQLLTRKNTLENDLADTGKEIEQWLELSERTFNFACYARYWFEHGDNTTKRSILGCLGSNLVLKDQKINVQLHPFFLNILENKKSLVSADRYARTTKNIATERQKDAFASSRHTWLPG